ncbi:hypothetical protein TRAPUB_5527 [Trametes pubescens]|uniref:Uncharacterized protein n=1 Tax=Trametes pubescens TaxID=154538 RepID=A0A1M2V868_TRAPU|nr:hypothetical protein TRAPUB_5527 [Trametes pubescens]
MQRTHDRGSNHRGRGGMSSGLAFRLAVTEIREASARINSLIVPQRTDAQPRDQELRERPVEDPRAVSRPVSHISTVVLIGYSMQVGAESISFSRNEIEMLLLLAIQEGVFPPSPVGHGDRETAGERSRRPLWREGGIPADVGPMDEQRCAAMLEGCLTLIRRPNNWRENMALVTATSAFLSALHGFTEHLRLRVTNPDAA